MSYSIVPERMNGEQQVRAYGAIRLLPCLGPVGSNPIDASHSPEAKVKE